MPKDIFKETRTPLINDDEPKSLFTVERKAETFTFDNNHPFHYHNWYELYYLQQGSCTYYIGNHKYSMNEGDWVFVPPSVEHKVVYLSSPHVRYLVYFTKDYLPLMFGTDIKNFFSHPVYTPPAENAERVWSILAKMYDEFLEPDEYSVALNKGYLMEIFVEFLRNPTERSEGNFEQDIFIAHILEYISYNYSQNISLERIAVENDISVSYLSRRFKKATGLNISEYVRMIRINQAKRLLVETDDSIHMISEKCGFNDSNYFSYVFKEHENVSPLNYRKNYTKNSK